MIVTAEPQASTAEGVPKSGVVPHEIVDAAGTVKTGAMVSTTEMVVDCGAEALPQASVAIQVRVTSYELQPAVVDGVVTSLPTCVIVTAEPQASTADGVPKTGVVPQEIVEAAGTDRTGAIVSTTEMVVDCGAEALPQASVAIHVRVTS